MSALLLFSVLLVFVSFYPEEVATQTDKTWYQLEPSLSSNDTWESMFTAIYNKTLFLIGGSNYQSVQTLSLSTFEMREFANITYQPDLNVIDDNGWQMHHSWFNLEYGIYCETSQCSTQIDNKLYIVSPLNVSNNENTNTIFVYNLLEHKFDEAIDIIIMNETNSTQDLSSLNSCVVNNYTHIFIIGGGDYNDHILIVLLFSLSISSKFCIYFLSKV